jgi:thiol-disulfide isomerase/thioredoxin
VSEKLLDLSMKWIAISFAVFVLLESCRGQEKGTTISAEKEFYDDGKLSNGICFLTLLSDNKVYDYQKEYLIKIPEEFKGKKIAWGSAYFTGLKKSKTDPNVFFLILDYDSISSKIVFDKNGDGDFTNDSLISIMSGKWVTTSFLNAKDEKGEFVSKFLFKNDLPDSLYGKLHKAMTGKWPGTLDSKYMVFDKRKNYKKVHLPDSNIITLVDYNCNGFFNDKQDKILAGNIQKGSRAYNSPFFNKNVKSGVELPFKNNTYKLLEVDKYGNNVTVFALNKIIDTTETLPKFQFINEKGNKKDFQYTSSKEYVVLYIWGAWCIGCHVQAPAFVKLIQKYTDKLDYFTFNTGDKEEVMQGYLNNKQYPFQSYRIDKTNVEKLYVEAFPSYIIIDKNQKIVLRTSDVESLGRFLKAE